MKNQNKLLCLLIAIVLASSTCLPYLANIFGDTDETTAYDNAIDYGTTSPPALYPEATSPPAIDILPEPEATSPPAINVVPDVETTSPPAIIVTPPPVTATGSISGYVWLDDTNEKQPVADFPVYLFSPEDLTQAIAETTTDITGAYIFEDLNPGEYVLGIQGEDDYILPDEVTEENMFAVDDECYVDEETEMVAYTYVIYLLNGQNVEDVNAVLRSVLPKSQFPPPPPVPVGSISGFVFYEDDDGEQPVADYTVYLYSPEDLTEIIAETVTDITGAYTFDNLAPGEYVLAVASQVIGDFRYQLPAEITEENMFAIGPDNDMMAVTETIVVAGSVHVTDINAMLQRFINFRPNTIVTIGDEEFVVDHFVGSPLELRNAIGTSTTPRTIVIALTANIQLNTTSTTIPTNNHITIITDPASSDVPLRLIQNAHQRHFWVNGTLRLVNVALTSTLANTSTLIRGGVLVMATGHLILGEGASISNCRNDNRGAGVMVGNGRFTMDGGEIFDNIVPINTATHQHGGAGVYLESSAIFIMNGGTIRNNTITSTFASWQGGAGVMAANSSTFIMNGGTIRNNTSALEGGGVFVGPQATFTMYGGSITDNVAMSTTRGGGGIAVMGGTFVTANPTDDYGNEIVTPKIISGNSSRGVGGGLMLYRNDTATGGFSTGTSGEAILVDGVIMESNFTGIGNVGTLGGAIMARGGATLIMEGGIITGNNARTNGGGIAVDAGPITMELRGGTISNNTANNGGGMYISIANLGGVTINPPFVFTGNSAREGIRIDDNLAITHQANIRPGTVSVNWNASISHAFTNFDINVTTQTQSTIRQVTFETGRGNGTVTATEVVSGRVLNSGDYVFNGTQVRFDASPPSLLEEWRIGTSTAVGGPFNFILGGTDPTFTRQIITHTHVVGHFREAPPTTDVTVSKTIDGDFANMGETFDFTVYFANNDKTLMDAGTQFEYTGGQLVLDEEGKATFILGHGQAITIKDVPTDAWVRIVETFDARYITHFKDSAESDSELGTDTGLRPVGEDDRTFGFLNTRYVPPPMGVALGKQGLSNVMLLAIPVILLGLVALERAVRRRRAI